MVAAVAHVDFRSAAELGGDHHQRAVEHATLVEISDEAADGVIERRHELGAGAFDVHVRVPGAVVHADETDAGFDEAAC